MENSNAPVQQTNNVLAQETPQEKHKRLFRRGMTWLGTGLLVMGLSFAVTFVLFHTDQSFASVMYIMNTLGGCCMLKGMADIVGF